MKAENYKNDAIGVLAFMPALLLSMVLFFPTPYFLPVFPYSFIICAFAFPFTFKKTRGRAFYILPAILVTGGGYLALNGITNSNIYFLSSVSLGLMVAPILRSQISFLYNAAVIYLAILAGGLVISLVSPSAAFRFGFVITDVYGEVRYRGLNDEPNYMAFSLVLIYVLLLYRVNNFRFQNAYGYYFFLGMVWVLAAFGRSVYGLGMLAILSFLYLLINKRFVLAILFSTLLIPVIYVSERFWLILTGDDNSANFRTWGSFEIATDSLYSCGNFGCGIGSSRAILYNDFGLDQFSGMDLLPNLLATSILEGGFGLFLTVIMAILWSCNIGILRLKDLKGVDGGLILSMLLILITYSATSSFLYDPHFWAACGLVYAVSHFRQEESHILHICDNLRN